MQDRDQILLHRIKSLGDEKAFEYVYHSYFVSLCNFSFGIVNAKADAEDIVNDCFLELWTKREVIDIKTSLRAYLFISVRNLSINRLRKQKIEKKAVDEQKYLLDFQEQINHQTEKYLEVNNLEERLNLAINKLPQQCKYIFYLNRFENMKYKEIAKKLNISTGTVKTQIARALSRLRSEFEDVKGILFTLLLKRIKNI